jgi:hypothetical protein
MSEKRQKYLCFLYGIDPNYALLGNSDLEVVLFFVL